MSKNTDDKDFAAINIDIDDRRPIGRGTASAPSTEQATQTTSSSGGKGLVVVCLLLALAASGACAYLYQQLSKAQQEAVLTEARIQSLEQKLSATGEEIGNSTVALQVKVNELTNKSNELWSQMDKLWASAWRRNQADIKDLDKSVNALQSDVNTVVKGIEKQISDVQAGSVQMLSRVNSVNDKLNGQANDILAASVSAEQATEMSAAQQQTIKALSDKVLLMEKRNTSMLNKMSDLEVQIKELSRKTVSVQTSPPTAE